MGRETAGKRECDTGGRPDGARSMERRAVAVGKWSSHSVAYVAV